MTTGKFNKLKKTFPKIKSLITKTKRQKMIIIQHESTRKNTWFFLRDEEKDEKEMDEAVTEAIWERLLDLEIGNRKVENERGGGGEHQVGDEAKFFM